MTDDADEASEDAGRSSGDAGGTSQDDGETGGKVGTFLVTEADEGSAVLRDVTDGQVHTLPENPDLAAGEAVEGTVAPEPPMEVTWELREVARRWRVEVVDSDLEPTTQVRETAADQPPGELTRIERAGSGEVHVLTVPDPAAAAADVMDDEATIERAARLGATRVEVRRGEGLISVRYLPE